MKAVVTELPLEEPARFNPGRLEALCQRIGEVRAETEVALALDRLSAHLAEVGRMARKCQFDRMQTTLADLVRDADLIGMATLARVGDDVLDCLIADDPVALSATLARLRRVGDRSIHAVWDLEDLSG